MKKPFLKLAGICKRFDKIEALRHVDLEVAADELLVVLGPTGAGKTTLLRTIVGLEQPEAGRLELGGRDITELPPAARDMALVFQNFSLYPDWTVRRNLEFPLRAPGRQESRHGSFPFRSHIAERVQWAADLLKITPLLDRSAVTLSGGEMQRVAIGRAIVRRPRIFLLDEPLSNLDAKLRETLRVELVCLRRELRTPMIFVTHDQVEALSMADRIVVLSSGRILQTGTPAEIYRRPVSPEVARQLGQPPINILEVRRGKGVWLSADDTPVMPGKSRAPRGTKEMRLGIRPEDIRTEGGTVEGIVRVVEEVGPEKILLVDWAGTQIHILPQTDGQWQPGDKIAPQLDREKAILWPVGTS